jgi:hypothetical protein
LQLIGMDSYFNRNKTMDWFRAFTIWRRWTFTVFW